MNPPQSFTTLSTIAIQAGQSQMVVSVLQSGSLVHLQLVQVHPGLCEIGSNQEENQTLFREQQQLMIKLKKHEEEVLAVVGKRSRKQEEEQEVEKAMLASLNEGWLLLLQLLERRQEVLMLASDFYCTAQEFAASVNRVEDLHIRPDNDRLTEVQLTYNSIKGDVLRKSLQVLTSSSILLKKLRQLQRIEAAQRRGEVLQDAEESFQTSQCSKGAVLRLEEQVETLQDRRRRADLAVRLQLQQAENNISIHKRQQESRHTSSEQDWTLTVDEVLEAASDLKPEPRSDETARTESTLEETRHIQRESRADLELPSTSDESGHLQLRPGSEVTGC